MGKPEFAAFTPLESRSALLDGCISGHSPSICPSMLGALLGLFVFFGYFPRISHSMRGALRGLLAFSGNIPRICHSVLGALRGLLAFSGNIPRICHSMHGALLGLLAFFGQYSAHMSAHAWSFAWTCIVVSKNLTAGPNQKHLLKRYTNDTLSL